MGSPARSSSAQLLLLACLRLLLFLDAPGHAAVAAAAKAASPFSFSFDFSNSSSYRYEDLQFEGDAGLHGNKVDLTCNSFGENPNRCEGRVSYAHPVPFYDATTGEVASFHTQFKFTINTSDLNQGDGMAFFLAYFPSRMPPRSGGGSLGLVAGDGRVVFGPDQFVAVEFDTYQNDWDPSNTSNHIGIDINSVRNSVNTTGLQTFILNGSMTASVTYDNTTRMLAARLRYDDDRSLAPVEVSSQLPDPVTSLLPPEVAVGFSGATGDSMEVHQILSWSFSSTLAPPHKVHDMKAAIVGGSIGGALALVLLVWCILSCFKWTSTSSDYSVMRTGGPRRFEYRDLAAATDNFSQERVLGQGAFGVVYKASFSKGSGSFSRESGKSSTESGTSSKESGKSSTESGSSSTSKESEVEMAVKKILNEQRGGNADFFAEIKTISEAKHKNLVKLKGWCHKKNGWNMFDFMCWCRKKKEEESGLFFLVYELMPNGNLYEHLQSREQVLPWPTRYGIVKGIGSALVYLHHDCNPYILHRDIKPSNILLDNNFNAKLADFGLSRIANENNASLLTNAVGTEGYIDPQCRKDGEVKFNRSSDVYSFGILLLDIACTGKSREQVWDLYTKSAVMEAADPKLGGDLDGTQMERVAVLGLWCSLHDSANRPTVQKAMNVLERDEPLPDLRQHL